MPSARRMTNEEVSARLPEIPDWQVADGKLRRELRFRDFSEAFAFMVRVAFLAEQHDHHPDWSNVYGTVVIGLATHDAGGITSKDFDLAAAVDALLVER